MHTTNYYNTLIKIAEDCPIASGEMPAVKGQKKSVANHQYDMLNEKPYTYTSDDVLFTVFADRKEIPKDEIREARATFFSKGQPCFRASPLTKRYGWGIHSNSEGKIAMYGAETMEYKRLVNDTSIKKVNAMRSKRG